MTRTQIESLIDCTSDAYSFQYYGVTGWRSCIKMLDARGYDRTTIETILRSKYTRWASDMSGKPYGRNTGRDLIAFMDRYPDQTRRDWPLRIAS